MAEDNNTTINLDALLLLASVTPQFGAFGATAEGIYEAMLGGRTDLVELFEDEEELDSLLADIRSLADAASDISDELQDKITERLNGLPSE